MHPLYELGRTHHAEALREAEQRRRPSALPTCRRRLLGLPIGPACDPCAPTLAR